MALHDPRNSPFFSLGISPIVIAEKIIRWDLVGERPELSPSIECSEGLGPVLSVQSKS